jgi:hypothetical protein
VPKKQQIAQAMANLFIKFSAMSCVSCWKSTDESFGAVSRRAPDEGPQAILTLLTIKISCGQEELKTLEASSQVVRLIWNKLPGN